MFVYGHEVRLKNDKKCLEETLVDRKLKTDRNLKIKILHIYIEKSCMYIFHEIQIYTLFT